MEDEKLSELKATTMKNMSKILDFDEEVVKSFKKTFSVFPLGICLKLSNGVEGYVIKQNKNFPYRPIIRVLYESETRKPIKFYEIDLLQCHNIVVQTII